MDFYDAMRQEQLFHANKGYGPEHDDEHGQEHLVTEVIYRLTHQGEVSSPDSILHNLIQVGSIIGAMCDQVVRNNPIEIDYTEFGD
jgi:hypothetical protein